MSTGVRTRLRFEDLQEKAAILLELHHIPPQRYGTAFHLTPPFIDVREISPTSVNLRGVKNSKVVKDFGGLSDSERKWIFETVTEKDPYLLWQIVNVDSVAARVLNIQEGQTMDVKIEAEGLLFVFLGKDAQLTLEHSVANNELAINRVFVWQEAGSNFNYWGLRSGNDFLTERVQVNLIGRGAVATVRHLTFGKDKQQSDIEVSAYHAAPQTESSLAVRTAAADKHVSVYRGLIDIDERAKGSVGYQQGRALLLSRKAVVDNLPELAIRTNDVKCSHGVNTTHIDDAALFYMRSRGLDRAQARQLAVRGFYHDTMDIPAKMAHELSSTLDSFYE